MASTYNSPGVYREEIFLKPRVKLATGVPGFVGLASPTGKDGAAWYSPVALHRKEEFAARFAAPPESYLGEAITGFFENGGTRCYVVCADPGSGQNWEAGLGKALDALASLHDMDLVAIPDAMALILPNQQPDTDAVVRLQQKALEHCGKLGDRLVILDAMQGGSEERVLAQRNSLAAGQKEPLNGALYFPWIKTAGTKTAAGRFVPPCGHVAGIVSRTDAERGVYKAPANVEVVGAVDLENPIDNRSQDQLNPEGINCLRAFPGRGIRIWGARTLSRAPEWRYISVRRLFLTLGRWIDLNLIWAAFEPNSPRLWVRIQRELTTYLPGLWQAGALKGEMPDASFYVKCDAETNPQESREVGRVVTEIGLAPLAPAEFIVVRIIHRPGQAETL